MALETYWVRVSATAKVNLSPPFVNCQQAALLVERRAAACPRLQRLVDAHSFAWG